MAIVVSVIINVVATWTTAAITTVAVVTIADMASSTPSTKPKRYRTACPDPALLPVIRPTQHLQVQRFPVNL
jgi:hypothetical protein